VWQHVSVSVPCCVRVSLLWLASQLGPIVFIDGGKIKYNSRYMPKKGQLVHADSDFSTISCSKLDVFPSYFLIMLSNPGDLSLEYGVRFKATGQAQTGLELH
jgi:hypothetical protein